MIYFGTLNTIGPPVKNHANGHCPNRPAWFGSPIINDNHRNHDHHHVHHDDDHHEHHDDQQDDGADGDGGRQRRSFLRSPRRGKPSRSCGGDSWQGQSHAELLMQREWRRMTMMMEMMTMMMTSLAFITRYIL